MASTCLLWVASLVLAGSADFTTDNQAHPSVVHFPIKRLEHDTPLVKRADKLMYEDLGNARSFYALTCGLGTPPQYFQMVLDTGSSDFWVMSPDTPLCRENRCDRYSTFNASDSSTFRSNHTDFYAQYGDSSEVNGTWSQDVFTLFGENSDDEGQRKRGEIKNFNFAYVNTSSSGHPVAGIGLMNGESSYVMDNTTYQNLPLQLKSSGMISYNAYSLWLNSYADSQGSILFGGIDTGAFKGPLYKFPMVPVEIPLTVNRLALAIDQVFYRKSGGDLLPLDEYPFPAVLDSGSTLSVLPSRVFGPLMAQINADFYPNVNMYMMDCRDLSRLGTSIAFDMSGVEYEISLNQLSIPMARVGSKLLCSPGFVEGSLAILGDNVLRNLYVVYDLEKLEIGLAEARTDNSVSTTLQQISTGIPGSSAPRYSKVQTRPPGSFNLTALMTGSTDMPDMFTDLPTPSSARQPQVTVAITGQTTGVVKPYTGYSQDVARLSATATQAHTRARNAAGTAKPTHLCTVLAIVLSMAVLF